MQSVLTTCCNLSWPHAICPHACPHAICPVLTLLAYMHLSPTQSLDITVMPQRWRSEPDVFCVLHLNPLHNKYLGLARTVYIHRIWLYIRWFPCQKYRIYTPYMAVYTVISLPKTPYIHRMYMVLANPSPVPWHFCQVATCYPRAA